MAGKPEWALTNEERAARDKERASTNADIVNGGYSLDANDLRRASSYNYGRALGQKEFYDDPDMKDLRSRNEELAKGYDGKEYSALRENARNEIAGQRSNYLKSMQGKLARGGAGGARAAAVSGAADQKFSQQGADSERKLALDSANMKRQGTSDLQKFILNQKLGATGLAYSQQALGSADYAADRGVEANKGGGKK